jgi:hypothetical protein
MVNAGLIFWGLTFPFHYRKTKDAGRTRHIHIVIALTSLILPLPFALVHLKDGFASADYPTTSCIGRSSDFNYYFFTLPESVMLCITAVLLVFVFRKVLKV